MPWVRFDDQYPIHRKVDGLSDAAFRLHTSAIFWSARNLTDGFVSRGRPRRCVSAGANAGTLRCRVRGAGSVAPADEDCPSGSARHLSSGDGWVIHDYWEFQPSKVQVLRDRAAAARRQKKWREARNPQDRVSTGTGPLTCNPHIHRDERITRALTALLTLLVHLPRPAPKGSGVGRRHPGRRPTATPAPIKPTATAPLRILRAARDQPHHPEAS